MLKQRTDRRSHTVHVDVRGPWSLATSRTFWEGFSPAALKTHEDIRTAGRTPNRTPHRSYSRVPDTIRTVFRVDADWSHAAAEVTSTGEQAQIEITGDGDLDSAAAQVARFLAFDVDGRGWPDVADRDPVIADAQQQLPGLRPCGFHSPYEAAAWAVLSQRVRILQAARLRDELIEQHGDAGAFPAPDVLRRLDLDLPGRKAEYLHHVAMAALEGRLDGTQLRDLDPNDAMAQVQQIKGLGPFAAELVVLRGANAPDAMPRHEGRLDAEITERYGAVAPAVDIAEAWRPYRTWAAVHLRVLREQRTQEIAHPGRR
jgi:DNA-3-methyladenine glycosylase II